MQSLRALLNVVIDIYIYIIIINVVLSWLVAFDVINLRNRLVAVIYNGLNALVEPILRPIRRILPSMGGIDLSPMVLFLLLFFLKSLINEYWPRVG